MAAPKKDSKIEKKTTAIRVLSDHVVIENLKIKNSALAEILKKEKKTEHQVLLLEEIADLGVNLYSTLKGRAETDFAKKAFDAIKDQLSEKLDDTIKNIEKDYDKYFDPKKGTFAKTIESTEEELEKTQEELTKQFTETTEDLRESLDEAFEDFLDEKSKESAIGKISSLLDDFDDKTLEMLKDIKQTQTEAFEKALDPEEKKSKINVLRDQLKEHTEKELELLTKKLDEVILHLGLEKTKEESLEKSTGKGTLFEDIVQAVLSKISVSVNDFVEPTSNVRGKTGNKGDHTVTIDKQSASLKTINIVFESKTKQMSIKEINTELTACMENRSAEIGVIIFDKQARVQKITELPFYPIDDNKALVVLDPEMGGDLPLQVAYMWARYKALMSASDKVDEDLLDLAELMNKVKAAQGALDNIKQIKTGHTNAKSGIKKSEKFLEVMESDLKENLDQISTMFKEATIDSD